MNWTLLNNSLLVSAWTTLGSVAFGFFFALSWCSLGPRWRRGLLGVAVVALALPPFLVTGCWLRLLGWNGAWRAWLPLDLYSLGGTVWVLALMLWPISALLMLGAWQRLEPNQLDSEPALAGLELIRWLLLPLGRSALGQAAILTFVLALNNFAVPEILQVKVFPAEIWVEFNTNLKTGSALLMSWPLIVAPLILLGWLGRREIQWPRLEGTAPAGIFRRQLGGGWFWFSTFIAMVVALISVGLPLVELCANKRTWLELPGAIRAGQETILNSGMLASGTAALVVGIGLATWRWPLRVMVWLPFLVPGMVLGIVLISVFNRPILSAFYQCAGIVFLAWALRYLAAGWTATAHAMRSVDRDLSDSARLEGASRWQLLRHVQWPQVAPQIAAGWYLTYLFCLWDAETLILIMPPGAETLAVRVFNFLHYGHNPQVNALCLVLLMLAVAPLIVFEVVSLTWPGTAPRAVAQASCLWGGTGILPVGWLALVCVFTGCSPATSPNQAPLQSRLFSRVQVIGSRGAGLGEFNKPRSVAVDEQDNLYVVDMTGRVQKFSPAGEFLGFWQMPQTDQGKPKGMCRDKNGNIVVLEPHYSRVNHFTPEGKLVAQWGAHGTNAGELAFPRSVIVNSLGEILVSEYGLTERVQQFSAQGRNLIRVLGRGGTGDGEFNRAEGLGIDRQDRLYVADSCNHRVQIFSHTGKFLAAYGRPGTGRGELSYPYDLKVDEQGFQFVCEFGNSRIQVFDPNNQPVEILGGPGAAPGRFSNPWGVALDSKGNLYVADAMNHRVQKFIRN